MEKVPPQNLLYFEDRKGSKKKPSLFSKNKTSQSTSLIHETTTHTDHALLPIPPLNKDSKIQTHHPTPLTTTNTKWHDEDDDRITVDLLQFDRLKKLRKNESEHFISGTEYTQRLTTLKAFQKHHRSNHEIPSWAIPPSRKLEKKRKVAQLLNKKKSKSSNPIDLHAPFSNPPDSSSLPPLPMSTSKLTLDPENDPPLESEQEEDDETDQPTSLGMDDGYLGEAAPVLSTLLRSTAPLIEDPLSSTHLPLASDFLHVSRLPNVHHVHGSIVSKVQFHPNCNLLVTVGLDKTFRMAHVNGQDNPTLAQLHFRDLPLFNCAIHPSGDHVVLTGQRTYWYSYQFSTQLVSRLAAYPHREDILPSLAHMAWSPTGRYLSFLGRSGHVVIVDGVSKKWITHLKVNGEVRGVTWMSDTWILLLAQDGQVYTFDLTNHRCIASWTDHLNHAPGPLACARSWMATGTYSGMVNVYTSSSSSSFKASTEMAMALPSSEPPTWKLHKSLGQLITPITGVRFNHDTQLLCMWSRSKKDQLKLVHVPTGHVFHNWPTQRTPLGYVQTMDFSPHSSIMAIGNDKGRVLLYKLKHYQQY
ncbi:U3 snoRNP protein [Coelomomyces lativittatus]|nr:U3 snoRNP protein [Coelomomyces lativittatus]KAJ1510144.1 U3 snoRNP protein [Coelomomyces lativittatus]KAJ1513998.1 U3 snoRNP protein [Coelomomyces lativittatus]